jgi:hypothetical protein
MTDKLYPELSDEGVQQFENAITAMKKQMEKAAVEAIDGVYVGLTHYIESDAWSNFRSEIVQAVSDYRGYKKVSGYDAKKIRRAIFEDFREEIISDLNQDNIDRIAELEEQIEQMRRTDY